jgi:hypothetical protein
MSKKMSETTEQEKHQIEPGKKEEPELMMDKDILKVNPKNANDLKKLGTKFGLLKIIFKIAALSLILGILLIIVGLFTNIHVFLGLILATVSLYALIRANKKLNNMVKSGEKIGLIKVIKREKYKII